MSDTPTPTPAPTLLDKAHDAVNAAGDWIAHEKDVFVHGLVQAGLSKPVVAIVTAAEDALANLPAALAEGEKSLADALTPENVAALEAIAGKILAQAVKEFLARIPAAAATATTTAAAAVATTA